MKHKLKKKLPTRKPKKTKPVKLVVNSVCRVSKVIGQSIAKQKKKAGQPEEINPNKK